MTESGRGKAPGGRGVIRLGDKTSHGGWVSDVTATHSTVGGRPVARVGDLCVCPIAGHTHCVIVQGNPRHTVDGIAVAYDGDTTSCGATLQSSAHAFRGA